MEISLKSTFGRGTWAEHFIQTAAFKDDARESVFFVTDDPEGLQTTWQILASPDGTQPAEDGLGWEGKAHALADLPAAMLSGQPLLRALRPRAWWNELQLRRSAFLQRGERNNQR